MNNSLSLVKIIGGLSKTLNVANKLIPLYQEIKPYIGKANKLINNNIGNLPISKSNNNIKEIIEEKINNFNQPTFFQ